MACPSERLSVENGNPRLHIAKAKEYLKRIGFTGHICYDSGRIIETEEPDHLEVFMGTGIGMKSPEIAYTRNIGTCQGIGFYNRNTKQGSLFHIPGAEESSVQWIKDVIDSQIKKLGEGLDAMFVSGLDTIDNESLKEIQTAREESIEYIDRHKSHFNKFETGLCEKLGEYISYFSLDAGTGIYRIEKEILSIEKLVRMDIETDIALGRK